jgi:hypothetical protein
MLKIELLIIIMKQQQQQKELFTEGMEKDGA